MIEADVIRKNLSNIKGHKLAKDLLIKSLTKGSVSAYLLVGPPNIGKNLIAKYLAAGVHNTSDINKAHPDTIFFDDILIANTTKLSGAKEKKWKDSVDHFIRFINLSPVSSDFKVAIIENIDRLSLQATNALLKTLEEPPNKSIIIVTAQDLEAVLPTIKSRLQVIRLNYISDDDMYKYIKQNINSNIDEIVLIANGAIGMAKKLIDNPDILETKIHQLGLLKTFLEDNISKGLELANNYDRESALDLINSWIIVARKLLIKDKLASKYFNFYDQNKLIRLVDQFSELNDSLKSGVNPRIALEALVLNWSWGKNDN